MDTPQKDIDSGNILTLKDGVLRTSCRATAAAPRTINWQVNPGQRWIISGLHASGKTALLKVAAGLQSPEQGTLSLFGKEYWKESEEGMCRIRRKIGFIFEEGNRLISHLTVAKNVALPLCYHEDKTLKEVWQEICDILGYLRILESINLLPPQLNLYQRHLVSLAQAILIKPQIFFIDNLGEGLDVVQRLKIKHLLWGLSQGIPTLGLEPAVVVMATQDLQSYLGFGTHYGLIAEDSFLTFQSEDDLMKSDNSTLKKLLGKEAE